LGSDQDIQAAVLTVGAVEVGFTVYEDFINYKGGVYKYTEGGALGGHAVKIVGWGSEGEEFYWIVQNSWGPTWGPTPSPESLLPLSRLSQVVRLSDFL